MSDQSQLSLQDQINADLKRAMLERNEVAKLALRAVKTALTTLAAAGTNHELTEAQVLATIRKEVKQRRDSAAEFEKFGAPEKAVGEFAEIAVLEKYLPATLSAEQIETIVREAIAQTGATSPRDMGKVMAAAMERVNGLAEGKDVNLVVRRLLSN